jgi:hypothetical protein
VVDVSEPAAPRLLGRVDIGGVPRGLTVDDATVYVAAGSEGLVIVDASDSTRLRIVSKTPTRGTAIRVDYSQGHAFVAAWNDARVYDVVSQPAAPRFVAAVRLTTDVNYGEHGRAAVTARTLGIAANGRDVFVGNWWVPYSYRLYPDRVAPSLVLPEEINLTDFGIVPAGRSKTIPIAVRNQGTAPLTLFNTWTTDAAFTVAPEQLRLAPGESSQLQVTYTANTGDRQPGVLNVWSDDPQQPVRTGFLVANDTALGVGKRLPETRVTLLDGTNWTSAQQPGKVMLMAYFATF